MSKISLRETIGLVFIITGLVLIPAAWAFSRLLWGLALLLLIAGVIGFYSERVRRLEHERTKRVISTPRTGAAVPSDIHNYTGWASGGRSETMDGSLEPTEADVD
jgi:hypothetical protein